MRSGWFKFYRQIFDNPICTKDSEYFFVWCYILSEVAYEETRVLFKNEEIILSKGQLLTTVKDIALKLKVSESKVNRILKKLEIEKQIEKQSSSKNTLITVLNWERYQSSEEQNEEQVTNERQTNDKPVTNKRQTDGKPSYYNKNIRIEEDKKERKEEGKNNIMYYCPEPEQLATGQKPIIEIILNDKSFYPISQSDIDEWQELYPAVNVIQELRKMKDWSNSNPQKRKTRKGIRRFISNWLSKEQDKGNNNRKSPYLDAIHNRISEVDNWV